MMSQYRPGDGAALLSRAVDGANRSGANPFSKLEEAASSAIKQTYGADGSLKPTELVSSQNGKPPANPKHPHIGLIGGG